SHKQPFATVLFGNPYTALTLPDLPALLLTYDFYDRAESSAVKALTGDAPITGHLPIALPGLFPLGHGLDRPTTYVLYSVVPATRQKVARNARPPTASRAQPKAPIAQLDRASGYEPGGRTFESCWAHHPKMLPQSHLRGLSRM